MMSPSLVSRSYQKQNNTKDLGSLKRKLVELFELQKRLEKSLSEMKQALECEERSTKDDKKKEEVKGSRHPRVSKIKQATRLPTKPTVTKRVPHAVKAPKPVHKAWRRSARTNRLRSALLS